MSWSKSISKIVTVTGLFTALIVLGGCGFKPIYGDTSGGNVKSEMSAVKILLIKDRLGQQLHNHLLDRINPFGRPANPRYALRVLLTESKQELAVRKSNLATRANLNFSASYSLTRLQPGSKPVLSGTARVVSSYNILQSDYATSAAEKDARARAVRELGADITSRLATYFRAQNGGA